MIGRSLSHGVPWQWLGLSLLLGAACVTVNPVVLDRKTQLENQILGTFQRLEDEVILASSVRGDRPADRLTPLEREAVEAMMLREFIRDDIEALKSKQVVGEANTGLLVLLTPPSDPAEKQQAQLIVREHRQRRDGRQQFVHANVPNG